MALSSMETSALEKAVSRALTTLREYLEPLYELMAKAVSRMKEIHDQWLSSLQRLNVTSSNGRVSLPISVLQERQNARSVAFISRSTLGRTSQSMKTLRWRTSYSMNRG